MRLFPLQPYHFPQARFKNKSLLFTLPQILFCFFVQREKLIFIISNIFSKLFCFLLKKLPIGEQPGKNCRPIRMHNFNMFRLTVSNAIFVLQHGVHAGCGIFDFGHRNTHISEYNKGHYKLS